MTSGQFYKSNITYDLNKSIHHTYIYKFTHIMYSTCKQYILLPGVSRHSDGAPLLGALHVQLDLHRAAQLLPAPQTHAVGASPQLTCYFGPAHCSTSTTSSIVIVIVIVIRKRLGFLYYDCVLFRSEWRGVYRGGVQYIPPLLATPNLVSASKMTEEERNDK
jgi:hypothetical protein